MGWTPAFVGDRTAGELDRFLHAGRVSVENVHLDDSTKTVTLLMERLDDEVLSVEGGRFRLWRLTVPVRLWRVTFKHIDSLEIADEAGTGMVEIFALTQEQGMIQLDCIPTCTISLHGDALDVSVEKSDDILSTRTLGGVNSPKTSRARS